jgi:uncharacterized membrane protein YfcA
LQFRQILFLFVAGGVLWRHFAVMVAGALTGGWCGAHYAQKADQRKVRIFIIGVGIAMSLYFLLTKRSSQETLGDVSRDKPADSALRPFAVG